MRQLFNIIRLEKFTIAQECVKLITDLFQVFQLGLSGMDSNKL